jgi:hypothetical protein
MLAFWIVVVSIHGNTRGRWVGGCSASLCMVRNRQAPLHVGVLIYHYSTTLTLIHQCGKLQHPL